MFTPVSINGVLHVDGMLSYEVPTTPLKQMGIDCVMGVHLHFALDPDRSAAAFLRCHRPVLLHRPDPHEPQWEKDADLLLEPNVDGFAFDDFARAPELIAVGEEAMRAALPALKQKLGIVEAKRGAAKGAKASLPKPAAVTVA